MKHLSLLLLVAVSLGACKKDSEPAPSAPTKTDLLLAKSWRLTGQTTTFSSSAINNGTPVVTDTYATSYPNACQRDNFLAFKANKTLIADEGPLKCSPTDPQTQPGTWDFNSDQTKLTLTDPNQGGLPTAFEVVTLSATTLQLRFNHRYQRRRSGFQHE